MVELCVIIGVVLIVFSEMFEDSGSFVLVLDGIIEMICIKFRLVV